MGGAADMTEPTWYIQEQQNRESREAMEEDVEVPDTTMREAEVANVSDDDFEDEDPNEWMDPDEKLRREIFKEVMERHPEMAFTGDSVQDYIYNGGDLESAGEDVHLESDYEDRYHTEEYY